MDSFLSGFSNNYGGTQQIGPGYAGGVSQAGTAGAGSPQGVDVTQLQPGDTFQGEIASVNGEDVQIQLANGQYMVAKLARDVQVALGQVLNLQVQSNKDNRVVLKPVYDSSSQMLRVGEAALRAANLSVNGKNLELVSRLIENGMSIDKKTLMAFNRLALQNPKADMADLIKLNKLQLPITDKNLSQLQNYQNLEHKLLDGIKEASEEILKLYDALAGNQGTQVAQGLQKGGMAGELSTAGEPVTAGEPAAAGGVALEAGGKFMEQVLTLLAGEDAGTANTQSGRPNPENGNIQGGQAATENQSAENPEVSDGAQSNGSQTVPAGKAAGETLQGQAAGETDAAPNLGDFAQNGRQPFQRPVDNGASPTQDQAPGASPTQALAPGNRHAGGSHTGLAAAIGQLRGEKPQSLPDKIVSFIRDGRLDIKDMKQLLADTDIGRMLTAQQKSKIFQSEPFKSMLREGLQRQWTLTPQELAQEGKVEEFYQKLLKESGQLSRMMDEAAQAGGQNANAAQTRAMGNINDNVAFMNQVNQMFSYVQLPLKLGNSQAHGDLYVYTNKKNMARRDGMLTAFLHLDMDNLGSLDVSIALQTGKNQVTTKFYLDEDVMPLVEGHIGELAQRLAKKGYQCKSLLLEKDEDKTVLEHIEEQVSGGSAVLSYQTFDTRA